MPIKFQWANFDSGFVEITSERIWSPRPLVLTNWNFFIWPTRPHAFRCQIPLKWMCIHFCRPSNGSPVNINPDIENFYAPVYTYFWGIWESAGGEEFIMSSNSFGLWRLSYNTLTFRRWPQNCAQSEEHFAPTNWSLDDIKIKSNIPIKSNLIDVPVTIANSTYALWKYRQTPAAQEEYFLFKPTKLMWE